MPFHPLSHVSGLISDAQFLPNPGCTSDSQCIYKDQNNGKCHCITIHNPALFCIHHNIPSFQHSNKSSKMLLAILIPYAVEAQILSVICTWDEHWLFFVWNIYSFFTIPGSLLNFPFLQSCKQHFKLYCQDFIQFCFVFYQLLKFCC